MMKNDGVTFEAAGRTFRLRFSTNALCDLEDKTGIGINSIGAQLQGGAVKLGFIRACFWAGLNRGAPDVTDDIVGDLIDEIGVDRASVLLAEAMQAAFPKGKEGPENPPSPPPTGTSS